MAVIVGSIFAVMLTHRIGEGKMLGLAIGAWGLFLLIFARMTNFLPGLVLFALLGLANAGSNVIVGRSSGVPPLANSSGVSRRPLHQ